MDAGAFGSVNIARQCVAARYVPFRKPRFLLRLARFYARAWAGCEDLRYCDLNITGLCNVHCANCFPTSLSKSEEQPLTLDEYRKLADQAAAEGLLHCGIQGGEPTVEPRLFDIIAALDPRRFIVSITTNGTRLDRTFCGRLYRAGVDIVVVSLHSGIDHEHDNYVGRPGAFNLAMQGIGHALDAGLRVQINTCLTHRTIGTYGFEFLVNWCIRARLLLNLVYVAPTGRYQMEEGVLLTVEDVRRIRSLVRACPYVRHDNDAIELDGRCPFGVMLYVGMTGEVQGCPFAQITFGNVRDEPLAMIRERIMRTPFVEARTDRCLVGEPGPFRDQVMPGLVGKNLPIKIEDVKGD